MAYLSIQPRQNLAVYYSDDSVWHQRLALWRVKEGIWVICTPDSDVYAEDLRGVEDGPSRVKVKGVDFSILVQGRGPLLQVCGGAVRTRAQGSHPSRLRRSDGGRRL